MMKTNRTNTPAPLNHHALLTADLAFMETEGPPSKRVQTAIYAYLWSLENLTSHPLGMAHPSLNEWREEAARLATEGFPE